MLVTLDFHFLRQAEAFELKVFSRDSSQPLAAANFSFSRSLLGSFELKRLDFDSKDPAGRVDRLRRFGQRLYDQIVTPEVAKVWSEYKQRHEFLVLCVRIAPDANELESIPWETLFDGQEFLAAGTRTTISRLPLDVQPQVATTAVPLPLKMLALVSSPLDLQDEQRLQIEREQEILLEAINDPAGQGRLRADFEDEAKLEILEGSLETPYQIFHFTGHGMAAENGGGLLLEDAQGRGRPTPVAEVLQSLQRGENCLRLAVLSGCQTARTINVSGFRDMARGLLRRNIPAVLAMQFSISDAGGLKFAESFYTRIAAGRSLELAVHAARRALLLSDNHFIQADAFAPVLLTSNGECLQTTESEKPPAVESPRLELSFFLPLPQLSYGFYRQRREYRHVRDGILQRNQRAVIVHGIGGIGKTALVSHVASRMKKRFQGVYAFDCSSGTLTPETTMIKLHAYFASQDVNALGQLLYQNFPADTLANYLAQILSQWSLLLIFDNFESQLERTDTGFRIADENLREFITTLVKTTATGSHFLFTSRYLFDLDDKRLGNIQSFPLEDLSRPEALNLMQKLQHLAPASYSEKLKALETFGGHPYALVTLDRYCNHQPLVRALEDAKNIHAELREFLAIELNYSNLSDPARELLNRLAAFRQSVPYEAAEWVLGKKVSYAAQVLEAGRADLQEELKSLEKSELLRVIEESLPELRQTGDLTGPIRELIDWGLLTPIREDAKLTELSIHTLVRDFCRFKQPGEIWRDRLRDAAAFYTNSTRLTEEREKSQTAVWIEMEAFELLTEAEDFNEAADLLNDASELLDRWGFGQYLRAQYHRLFDKLDARRTSATLHNFGNLLSNRGDYEQALEYYDRSLKMKEERGDRAGVAISLHQIGSVHYQRGDYQQALECYDRSLKMLEDLGDRAGVAKCLHNVGVIHESRGDYQQALEYQDRSLEIKDELGDHAGVARSLHQIGNVLALRGDYERALEHYDRSLKMSEGLDDRAGVAGSLHNIGRIHQNRGNYEQALEYYDRSLKIAEEVDDRLGVANALHQIGALFLDSGGYDDAFRHLLSALSIFIDLESPNAKVAVNNLHKLRVTWCAEDFDAAWKEATGEDVPDWLKE